MKLFKPSHCKHASLGKIQSDQAAVLEDAGVVHGEIEPLHISERDMVADPLTKYLKQAVWWRHMHYLLNKMGPYPQYPFAKSMQ